MAEPTVAMTEQQAALPPSLSLGVTARAALLWGGGFTLLRDVAQFAVMLILVRMLSPADYGAAAVVQSIVGVAAVLSFGTFSTHALQIRDPAKIDWQAHFTAAIIINVPLFLLTLITAWALSFTTLYHSVAMPLGALSVLFLVEIPGTLRHRMLEANHSWGRFRVLLIMGTLLALGVGLVVALLGGGVWALIVQPPLLGLPAAVDLFWDAGFKPDWTWSWPRYRDTFHYGINRVIAGAASRGRVMTETVALSSAFSLGSLGLYTRAIGLGTLLAGRVGSVVTLSLYPVITRAEPSSARFQRLSALVLQGVCWATAPAALFLCLTAADTVNGLYGKQWISVAPLLPLAVVVVALGGVASALGSLLLANDQIHAGLILDLVSALGGILVALTIIPFGAEIYLTALSCLALCVVALAVFILLSRGGITEGGVVAAIGPALVAGTAAFAAVIASRSAFGKSSYVFARLCIDGAVLAIAYIATLRMAFAAEFTDLLNAAPGGAMLARHLRLHRTAR